MINDLLKDRVLFFFIYTFTENRTKKEWKKRSPLSKTGLMVRKEEEEGGYLLVPCSDKALICTRNVKIGETS